MKYTSKRALCWLIAALMTAALMAFVIGCTDITYAENDDATIMRSFMGYESGEPATFSIMIHGLLAIPLGLISTAFPDLPWFTYAQLAMLALSCLVIAKSIMQIFAKHQKPLWLGAAFAAMFLTVLCMKHITELTFTITAAALAAAAVLQMFSIDHDRGSWRVIVGMLGALVLVLLSFALRYEGILAVLAFCGLAFAMIVLDQYGLGQKANRSLRPMIISLVVIAVALGGMVAFRQWEIQANDAQDYLDWHDARSMVMDFHNIYNVPQEAINLVGWDDATLNAVRKWFFLDPDVTTEAFQTLDEYMVAHDTRTFMDRFASVGVQLSEMFKNFPQDMLCLGLIALATILCLAYAFLGKNKRIAVSMLIVLALCAAMTIYLGYVQRLPLRAFMMIALPCAAFAFAFLPEALPEKNLISSLCLPNNGVCLIICLAWSLFCVLDVVPSLLPSEEEELVLGSAMADLEEYALMEPDSLILYDVTLSGSDMRALPDYSEGVPHNLTFWGGWGMRSAESVKLFESFDIDVFNCDPETFLRDDVFLATGMIDPPPTLMLDWISAKTGKDVDWEIWSEWGAIYILHFYEY